MPDVFITLGSNVEPETHLRRAVNLLAERFAIRAISRVYETPPINAAGDIAADQTPFLNAALLVDTDLPPHELKYDVLRPLEAQLGRVRTADKFAPRPIDLDIALYGDQVFHDALHGIVIPDPDIVTRAHIALPLADLAPGFVHPTAGKTLAEIAAPFAAAPGIRLRADIGLTHASKRRGNEHGSTYHNR